MLNMAHYHQYSEDNENQLHTNEERIILFISVTCSALPTLILWQNEIVFTFYVFFEQRSRKVCMGGLLCLVCSAACLEYL
jgi:hypothetical protein